MADPLPERERCPPWRTLLSNFLRDPGTESRIAANKIYADLHDQYYWLKPFLIIAFLGYMVYIVMLVLRLLRFKGAVEPASNQNYDCIWRLACPENTTCTYDSEKGRATCIEPVSRAWRNKEKANIVQHTLVEALAVGVALCVGGMFAWILFPRCLKCFKNATDWQAQELDETVGQKKRRKNHKSFGTGGLREAGKRGESDGLDDVHSMALKILASAPPSSSLAPKVRKDRKSNKKKSARRRSGHLNNSRLGVGKSSYTGSSISEDDGFDEFFATRDAPVANVSGRPYEYIHNPKRRERERDAVSRWSNDAGGSESGVSVNMARRMATSLHRMHTFNGDVDGASDVALSDAYFGSSTAPDFMGYALQLAAYCDGAGRKTKHGAQAQDSDDSLADLEESSLSELFHPRDVRHIV